MAESPRRALIPEGSLLENATSEGRSRDPELVRMPNERYTVHTFHLASQAESA